MTWNSKTLKIYPASPAALAQIESFDDKIGTKPQTVGKRRFPWNLMKIGECFVESYLDNTEKRLLQCCAFQKRYSGKQFAVIKHEDLKLFEVARIV
jgi:hypothetical protein